VKTNSSESSEGSKLAGSSLVTPAVPDIVLAKPDGSRTKTGGGGERI